MSLRAEILNNLELIASSNGLSLEVLNGWKLKLNSVSDEEFQS